MEEMKHCPVCLGRVSFELFDAHMSSHSKDEVVAALLRSTPTLPTSSSLGASSRVPPPPGYHFLAEAAAAAASNSASGSNPGSVIMPHMMGMSMVMSPVLIPQQNGPPIIFNVPSYVYPNLSTASAPSATNSIPATSLPSTLALKHERPQSPVEVKPKPSKTEETDDSKILTVETVSDLINAQVLLKSNEDIQIVVSNDLLETNEFKTFMSHLNLPQAQNHQENKANSNQVPPNTPIPTRPPSTNPPDFDDPQPSTSKNVTESITGDLPLKSGNFESDSEEEEDICLQDLVAMETMEQVHDEENVVMETDDQVFTIYKSDNLEPSFVNAILQEHKTESFECDGCGLHFPTHEAYHMHRVDSCKVSKESKNGGTKVKRSIKNFEIKSEENSCLSLTDAKIELDQPVLGAVESGESWKCNQCLASFESAIDLFQHHEELKKAPHKCTICHLILDDRKMVLAHKKEFHPMNNLLTKIKIEDQDSLIDVKQFIPNAKGEYVCEKCDRAFLDKELFTKHLTCHNEEKPFECLECGKKFAKAVLLRDHRKRHFEQGNYECNFCPKRFHTPIKLREHIRVHTGEAPLTCNICGKGFKRHSNLSEHKRIHDENRPVKPPKELFCHCGQVFKTKRELDWHTEEVHERIPKKCTHCGEVFVHSTSLTRHIRRKHQADFMPDGKKANLSAKCPICFQTFYKTSINKHIRIKHEGQKPYTCEICKMGFVTKNNLENHQWQHKGIRSRPFKCQLCRKAYLRQSQLDAHMRAHKGIKPFVCNDCGLQFSNKSNWQRHVLEHSGVRNYSCPHCNKKFSRSYYLTDHMKVHTGVKPYSCAICGKTAATRSNYNSHLRTHITREPVNSEV